MKNLIIIFVLMVSFSQAFAQSIEISEAPRTKDNGTYNSYLFELPDVDKKLAEGTWVKFIKDFKAKSKKNRKSNIWFSDNAKMPRLSNGAVDIYAKILEDENPNKHTTMIIWFDLGSEYLNSGSDSLKGAYAKEILTEYAMSTSKHHSEAIVEKEEKRLAELEKEKKKLVKANEEYYSTIEKAKSTIAKNEKNIEINVLDQENKDQEIEAQKAAVKMSKEAVKKFGN